MFVIRAKEEFNTSNFRRKKMWQFFSYFSLFIVVEWIQKRLKLWINNKQSKTVEIEKYGNRSVFPCFFDQKIISEQIGQILAHCVIYRYFTITFIIFIFQLNVETRKMSGNAGNYLPILEVLVKIHQPYISSNPQLKLHSSFLFQKLMLHYSTGYIGKRKKKW